MAGPEINSFLIEIKFNCFQILQIYSALRVTLIHAVLASFIIFQQKSINLEDISK